MLIGSERSELAIPEELPYYRFPLLTLHVLSYCFQVISFHYAAELETLRTRWGLVDSTGPFTLSSADSQTHARICGAKHSEGAIAHTKRFTCGNNMLEWRNDDRGTPRVKSTTRSRTLFNKSEILAAVLAILEKLNLFPQSDTNPLDRRNGCF